MKKKDNINIKSPKLHIVYIGWAQSVHLRRWAAYFLKLGHRITILSVWDKADPIPGIKIIRLKCVKKRLSFQKAEVRLRLLLLRPDICHVHWAHFAYLPMGTRYPFVVTIWGSDIYLLNEQEISVQNTIIEALNASSFITVNSRDLVQKTGNLIQHKNKIDIIQWGVDTDLFFHKPNMEWREKFNISADKKVILSIRNVTPLYQIETVFNACAKVLEKHNNIIIIQSYYNVDEKYLFELKELAENLHIADKIRWIGNLNYEEMPFLYNMSNIVVSVPNSDATAMSLLEAMACKVPIIVSHLPSVLEWIKNEENGLVVPVGDQETLTSAICRLLDDDILQEKIINNNVMLVKEKASQHIHMQKMNEIYIDLSNNRWALPNYRLENSLK